MKSGLFYFFQGGATSKRTFIFSLLIITVLYFLSFGNPHDLAHDYVLSFCIAIRTILFSNISLFQYRLGFYRETYLVDIHNFVFYVSSILHELIHRFSMCFCGNLLMENITTKIIVFLIFF